MKTLKEFLEGVELPFMAEAFTDKSTPADFDLDKPRFTVDVKDAADEATIKKLHNARKGVMVRVMKRSSGGKVCIDFTKDASEIDQFKKDLAKN